MNDWWTNAAGAPALAGTRILLVDDDLDTLDMFGTLLERAGAAIRCVDSGQKALDEIDAFAPHVLVSDIAMPLMTGLQLINRIRQRGDGYAEIPALAVSAHAQAEVRAVASSAGFNRTVAKPVTPVELITAIAALLGR